jgi:hypothetical protein
MRAAGNLHGAHLRGCAGGRRLRRRDRGRPVRRERGGAAAGSSRESPRAVAEIPGAQFLRLRGPERLTGRVAGEATAPGGERSWRTIRCKIPAAAQDPEERGASLRADREPRTDYLRLRHAIGFRGCDSDEGGVKGRYRGKVGVVCVSLRSRRSSGRGGGAFAWSADGTQRAVAVGQERTFQRTPPARRGKIFGSWGQLCEGYSRLLLPSRQRRLLTRCTSNCSTRFAS